tara:strand:+ start:1686 stop:2678 length:993 start_codon:yes stop_codon:yes gene_type:complete
VSRVLVRKADIVYDVMSGRPQLQVGVGARRDNDGRRMMPTFGGEGNLVAVQNALKDRAGRIDNIEREIPVDPRTGFRSSQDEKEFQHAVGQLGSGFASDQERIAFGARHEDKGAKFDAARRGAGIGGRIGQGLGALGTSLVGVMSGLSALEGGQGPLAAGLTGYTAAQQLGGMTPYLTEAGMRVGAGLGARRKVPENTSSTAAVAEPTMNNVNTTGSSVNPNLITSYGGASAEGPTGVGVQGTRASRRPRRATMAEPTPPMTATDAGEVIGSHLDNNTAKPQGLEPPNPRTAAEAAVPQSSLTAPEAAGDLSAYFNKVRDEGASSVPGGY